MKNKHFKRAVSAWKRRFRGPGEAPAMPEDFHVQFLQMEQDLYDFQPAKTLRDGDQSGGNWSRLFSGQLRDEWLAKASREMRERHMPAIIAALEASYKRWIQPQTFCAWPGHQDGYRTCMTLAGAAFTGDARTAQDVRGVGWELDTVTVTTAEDPSITVEEYFGWECCRREEAALGFVPKDDPCVDHDFRRTADTTRHRCLKCGEYNLPLREPAYQVLPAHAHVQEGDQFRRPDGSWGSAERHLFGCPISPGHAGRFRRPVKREQDRCAKEPEFWAIWDGEGLLEGDQWLDGATCLWRPVHTLVGTKARHPRVFRRPNKNFVPQDDPCIDHLWGAFNLKCEKCGELNPAFIPVERPVTKPLYPRTDGDLS